MPDYIRQRRASLDRNLAIPHMLTTKVRLNFMCVCLCVHVCVCVCVCVLSGHVRLCISVHVCVIFLVVCCMTVSVY